MAKPRHRNRAAAQNRPRPRETAEPKRAKPAAARQHQPARQRTASFWRGPGPIVGTLGGIIVLVVAFVLASRAGLFQPSTSSVQSSPTADPAVVAELAQVSPSVIDAVGTGGAADPLSHISGSALKGSDGKPEMLYVGAEWCPYCAAERWAMAVALDHFGSLSGLHFTTSSDASGEVFPNTHTLSFYRSTFSSSYLDFVPVELEDRNHNTLETMTSQEQQLAQAYDTNNGIPFIDIGNQYTMVGQGVPPNPLQGLSWQQIAGDLSNPNSPVTKAIVGNSNYLTAAICKLPGASAASICSDPVIKQIGSQLPG